MWSVWRKIFQILCYRNYSKFPSNKELYDIKKLWKFISFCWPLNWKKTKKQYVCIILRRLLYEVCCIWSLNMKFAVWRALCLFRTLFCFIAAFRCFEGFPRIEDFALSQAFVVSRPFVISRPFFYRRFYFNHKKRFSWLEYTLFYLFSFSSLVWYL